MRTKKRKKDIKSKGRLNKYDQKQLRKQKKKNKKNKDNVIYINERTAERRKKKQYRVNTEKFIRFLVVSVLFISIGSSIFNIGRLQLEQKRLLEENEELKREKRALQNELKQVNDPEYIEEQARIQLKLIKPGEILYILDSDNNSDETVEENED